MDQQKVTISKNVWDDALMGKSQHLFAAQDIIDRADAGKLIVKNELGHNYLPRRDHDNEWLLIPLT